MKFVLFHVDQQVALTFQNYGGIHKQQLEAFIQRQSGVWLCQGISPQDKTVHKSSTAGQEEDSFAVCFCVRFTFTNPSQNPRCFSLLFYASASGVITYCHTLNFVLCDYISDLDLPRDLICLQRTLQWMITSWLRSLTWVSPQKCPEMRSLLPGVTLKRLWICWYQVLKGESVWHMKAMYGTFFFHLWCICRFIFLFSEPCVSAFFVTATNLLSVVLLLGWWSSVLSLGSFSCTGVLADNQININVSAEQKQQQQALQSAPPPAARPSKPHLKIPTRARDKKSTKLKHSNTGKKLIFDWLHFGLEMRHRCHELAEQPSLQ